MNAAKPSEFKHTTLTEYPGRCVGITVLDEEPGFTGIYLRAACGGLWPARTVNRENPTHHNSVVSAWMEREGSVDLRKDAP